jgi:hypothetical protein
MTVNNNWRVISASVIGTHHRTTQGVCQDAMYPVHESDFAHDTLVVAVADGLGSASHAAEGAQYAVQTAVHALRSKISGTSIIESAIMTEVFLEVQQSLVQLAHELQVSVGSVACTLQLVAMNENQLLIGHIGDGLVLGVYAGESHGADLVNVLSKVDNQNYANWTHTITNENMSNFFNIVDIHQQAYDTYDGVILMTDGAQSLCYEYSIKQPYQPFFAELFKWAHANRDQPVTVLNAQLTEFFSSDDAREKTADDATFVLARHS